MITSLLIAPAIPPGIVHTATAETKAMPVYVITTRGFLNSFWKGLTENGYADKYQLLDVSFILGLVNTCKQ